jgi:nitroreductase
MELFEALRRRHSYRGEYLPQPVPRDALQRMLEAARCAPSGKNAQTTTFVAVDDPVLVHEIAGMHASNRAVQTARAFIACLVDVQPPQVFEGMHFQVEDCAAAVENMLLAITALGYASVWIDGWLRLERRAERIGELLQLPAGKRIRVLLPVGVPAEQRRQPEKKPLTERAWFNRYGGDDREL